MFDLPAFSIERDDYAEVRLALQAREWIERGDADRGVGIHASDLMDPLLAYWKRLKPQPLSERTVWLFVVGKILHHFVLDIAGPGKAAGPPTAAPEKRWGFCSPLTTS